jgi:hypothetical protein
MMASGLWRGGGEDPPRPPGLGFDAIPGRGPHIKVVGQGGGAVGMDAKQCRQRAQRCTELADRATDPHMKAVLQHLAERWLKSAAELEGSQASEDRREPNEPGH